MVQPHKEITETARERLKVIQEHTALGSGLQVARYDLELRGSGTLLGEEQAGWIDNLGYEFYMELLDEAIQETKKEKTKPIIEPDLNLKIKAFIPHTYISNIKLRLSYYRALAQIESEKDVDELEEELKDQFGPLPQEITNLFGLMLIRRLCVELAIKNISNTKENVILSIDNTTPLPSEKILQLTLQGNKKYQLAPGGRLKIRVKKESSWPQVYNELEVLAHLCSK